MTPQLIVLAGPNGAGKSTYYEAFLAESPLPFLNADLFAEETGVDSLEAAKIMDVTRDRMIADGLGFITETVFSDPDGRKLGMLRRAIAAGFDVRLVYIGLESIELSALRIEQRLGQGGHDVPRDRLARRYERSLHNLKEAIRFVPQVVLIDNSSADEPYRPIATLADGEVVGEQPASAPHWTRGLFSRKKR